MNPTSGGTSGFRWSGLLPLIGVVCVTALIIVPVPPAVVDALLTLNLAGATILLLAALSAPTLRSLSALPGLLLLATLFRLALNVSTTRLILGQADAGTVVQAFGEFVVAGSYLVGGVVFAILTVVQYVVIASGAGRVAEVGARFALDALPGAQAAIDADLRSGSIGRPEAERRRRELTTESRLYGALDGAMRFVRGDAVAALVITAVNLVGGIAVGSLTQQMSASEALRTYGLLTIGDGLAAQIPAVLLSVAAGLAVTRVDDPGAPGALPETAARQLGRRPTHIVGAGGLLLALGLIPGMPAVPFIAMGVGTVLVGWQLSRQVGADAGDPAAPWLSVGARLELRLGPDLLKSLGGLPSAATIADDACRRACDPARWPPPAVTPVPGPELGPDAWQLDLDGAAVARGVLDPSTPRASATALTAELCRSIVGVLPELVDLQAVSDLLDALSESHPALVREALDGPLNLPGLTRLVSLCLADRLPAGDLRALLDAVLSVERSAGGGVEGAPRIAEAIRSRFRRHLSALALEDRPGQTVPGFTLDPSLLAEFEEHAQHPKPQPPRPSRGHNPLAVAVAAPIALCDALARACEAHLTAAPTPRPVLFVPTPLRAIVTGALRPRWRHVLVLAPHDLAPTVTVEPAGELTDPLAEEA